ncbi:MULTISPECIES: thiamine biosynthesis protein ThiF [Sulfurimonas]|uniref:thiamine biosynthesis protein ThiF n=1 Tax=Sulfurimonas TaxID=202746 RepID=UPI0012655F6E|nr:thiamine biosynthesis protein ThiF [Sulfurimonas indica]
MTHGFDLNSPLVCEGIIGDGCGGGRIFFVEDEKLQVYDPLTQERMVLLCEVKLVEEIEKEGCIIKLYCQNETIEFNLSLLQRV